jgi:hypothetical protein
VPGGQVGVELFIRIFELVYRIVKDEELDFQKQKKKSIDKNM